MERRESVKKGGHEFPGDEKMHVVRIGHAYAMPEKKMHMENETRGGGGMHEAKAKKKKEKKRMQDMIRFCSSLIAHPRRLY